MSSKLYENFVKQSISCRSVKKGWHEQHKVFLETSCTMCPSLEISRHLTSHTLQSLNDLVLLLAWGIMGLRGLDDSMFILNILRIYCIASTDWVGKIQRDKWYQSLVMSRTLLTAHSQGLFNLHLRSILVQHTMIPRALKSYLWLNLWPQ